MTFVLMQNTSLPKYRPLSSTLKAAYLPVTSYIFLTSETCQLNKKRGPLTFLSEDLKRKKAASYSPALHCSTIGVGGLNFSVRNGKRWSPATITTWYGVPHIHLRSFNDAGRNAQMTFLRHKPELQHTQLTDNNDKVFGQLVRLGFDVTVFTPASYQRRSLQRPSMEF